VKRHLTIPASSPQANTDGNSWRCRNPGPLPCSLNLVKLIAVCTSTIEGTQFMMSHKLTRGILCLLCLASLPFLGCPADAQSRRETPLPSLLTAESQTVLDKLASLSSLPKPDWRYHAGDLQHGESPSVDDAGWQAVTTPSTLPAEAIWIRATIEVPKNLNGYDLTGTRISFRLPIDANGPVTQIVYFNGRRVAMGTDLEPIVLFADARPGDKVLVAVKLLHSEDQKRFRDSEQTIQFAANRPNPEDLRQEAVSASLLLPALGESGGEPSQKLQSAIQSVSLAALSAANQTAFDDSLRQAQAGLMTLRPLLQRADIHLTGNAHIDAAWLWPWTETVEVVRQTFGTALQLMDEYPKVG
jgi:alpha-mannosidase